MNKQAFLENITTGYDHWLDLIKNISPEEMVQPRLCGNWSLKDILAHIAWYEREMISLIKQHQLNGSKLWDLSTDERNKIIFEENRDRALRDIMTESRKVHADFIQALDNLSDDDLTDASHFKDMPGDWIPWKIIAENSSEHYRQHIPDIKSWLNKQ
jgi:uncharacterized damage-inducible protein DinB